MSDQRNTGAFDQSRATKQSAEAVTLISVFRPTKGQPIRAIALGTAVALLLAAAGVCFYSVRRHNNLSRLAETGTRVYADVLDVREETQQSGRRGSKTVFIARVRATLPSGTVAEDEFTIPAEEAGRFFSSGRTKTRVAVDGNDEQLWMPEASIGGEVSNNFVLMVFAPLTWIGMVAAMAFGLRLQLRPARPLDPALIAAARQELTAVPAFDNRNDDQAGDSSRL